MNALKTLWGAWKYFLDALYCSFRLKSSRLNLSGPPDEVWFIEAMNNFPSFFNTYYYLKASLVSGKKPKIIYFCPIISFQKSKPRLRSQIMNVLTQNRFLLLPWKWMYQAILPGKWLAITHVNLTSEQKATALKLLKSIQNKRELEALRYEGLWIGDLIYDTYMRFKPAATVDLQDPFLLEIFECTVGMIPFIRTTLRINKISHVLTVYTSYIHHGLTSRLGIQENINTNVIGVSHQIVAHPTLEFPYHMRNFHRYPEWIANYPDQEAALKRGKEIIETRLGGQKDRSSYYMKEGAFSKDVAPEILAQLKKIKDDSRKKIVFMCHDFIDSPHSTGSMLFPDFYEWMSHCLALAESSPYQFIVKPHPNSRPEDVAIVANLTKKFPKVEFLSKKTSNLALRDLDIEYIVTVYGTVAYEFAAMGYTVLCCGENPHSRFNFSIEVKDILSLDQILSGKQTPKVKVDMKEIYGFLFVQNYRYDRGEVDPFPWDFGYREMLQKIENDDGKTAIMKRAIEDVDSF